MTTILDAPAVLDFSRASLRPVDTTAETRSVYSGAEARLDFGGEWWEMTFGVIPMDWDEASEIAAWCDRLRDAATVARLEVPSVTARRGTTTADTVTVSATAAAGQRAVAVTGLGAGATLLAGSFVSTAADRLHRLRQDVTANGSGAATLSLFPRLRDGLSASAVLRLAGTPRPRGLFRLQGRPSLDWDAAQFAQLVSPVTLTFVEAL